MTGAVRMEVERDGREEMRRGTEGEYGREGDASAEYV